MKAEIPSDKLVPIALGDSSTVKVGDDVIAIGYPHGLEQTVSEGIVSGLDRSGSGSTDSRTLNRLIQVDAAINPSNTGGPLVNDAGQVIRMDTIIESPVECFTGAVLAIPMNQLKDLLPQLEQGEQVQRAWPGISGVDIASGKHQDRTAILQARPAAVSLPELPTQEETSALMAQRSPFPLQLK